MQPLIPDQIKGKENNIETVKNAESRAEAIAIFKRAYARINDPLHWHVLSRVAVARFLPPSNPNLNRPPLIREGNYLRIEIPGPGPKPGDGYDWVKVDKVIHEGSSDATDEIFGMTLRACSNPEKNTATTAHFFQSQATSTFVIRRTGNTVIASYHGRNEIPNIHTDSSLGNIRNAFVALGAAAGLSETIWSIIIKSFLKDEE